MLSDDLLDQARQLALVDIQKPRQANLRRAISSAYYALFPSLVYEACCLQIGSQPGQAALRHVADYDVTEKFLRSDVLTLIEDTKRHLTDFTSLPMTDCKRFFLACLWAWRELTNR